MDYFKIDAKLAAALMDSENQEEQALTVFIYITQAPSSTEIAFLKELGVDGVPRGRKVFTATLTPNGVARLSEQAWVKYLGLSKQLRMLNED